MVIVFKNVNDTVKLIQTMSEEDLRMSINYEASAYKRKAILVRAHARYSKLRAARERVAILAGELLL